MATTYFYSGIEYSADDIAPMVAYLSEDADRLPHYQGSTLNTIQGMMSWGDYRTAPEAFSVMCRVLAAARRALGEKVLE